MVASGEQVLRHRVLTALRAAPIGVALVCCPTPAHAAATPGSVDDIPIPGGLAAAVAVVRDDAPTDRARFLFDLIRRAYESPTSVGPLAPHRVLPTVVAHLDRAGAARPATGAIAETQSDSGEAQDTVPLPLPAQLWIDVVFGGRATRRTLAAEILRSRNAALFYYGLFSLDEDTRAWLASEPALVRELVQQHAARFTVAAPSLRVAGGRVRPPGGERAVVPWEKLVQGSITTPAEFVRGLLTRDEGRIAYFFGALGYLSEAQVQFGLGLAAPDPGERVESMRRVFSVFARLAASWSIDTAVFWRPTLDPALLLADLPADESGTPRIPGTIEFWRAVLADDAPRPSSISDEVARRFAVGERVGFPSLCELLARGDKTVYRRSHHRVLFASRVLDDVTPANARDALEAIRAAVTHPALIATLERAGVTDVAILARAARVATRLSAIDDDARAIRSLEQFQGAVFVLTRAARRGGLPPEALTGALASLLEVPLGKDGDYEGRLTAWLSAVTSSARQPQPEDGVPTNGSAYPGASWSPDALWAAPLDREVLRMMAGGHAVDPTVVDWEGTKYRVDFAWAEATRLVRVLGDDPLPCLTTARQLVAIADRLAAPGGTPDAVAGQAAAIEAIAGETGWEPELRERLLRAAGSTRAGDGSAAAARLRLLADDLVGRGLAQFAYAASLGRPERVLVTAAETARRHEFGRGVYGAVRGTEWLLPAISADGQRDWRVTGSILGLDVTLADLALVSVSRKPPARPPTINSLERRAFIEAAALVEPHALTDDDMRVIAAALRRGRERVSAAATFDLVTALADEIRLDPSRRTLLSWVATRDPARLDTFFAPLELFWIGRGGAGPAPGLHAWGAAGPARRGCLCLSLDGPRSSELLLGRRDAPLLASGFPDLNLRLAELLAEIGMPGALAAPVLAAATLDFVNTANPRGRDDRGALETFVRKLRVDDVEQYLALLTTDGPLVPVEDAPEHGS